MDVKALVLKHVDVAGLAADLVEAVIAPKLKELAADTASPIDDALVAYLLPVLKDAVLAAAKKVDA